MYTVSKLPRDVRDALMKSDVSRAPAPTAPAPPPSPLGHDTTHLKAWQREHLEARLAILREVERLGHVGGVEHAIHHVAGASRAGKLPPHLQALVCVANHTGAALSVRTIKRWRAAAQAGIGALAPRPGRGDGMPPWAAALLDAWRQPQKPSITSAVRALHRPGALPEGVRPPSYDQARRFLAKVGAVEKLRGRKGPRELKADRPFVRRDTASLLPSDVYTADGHTFDAEVAHPDHGRPFRPELTLIVDVATRRAVGWSVALAESGLAVLDALRHAATRCGIPAIFYVDRGSGYCNDMMRAPATGMMARLSIELTHSLPYNSQARGIVERAHQTIFVEAAKRLPTYIGHRMDPEAKKVVYRRTRRGTGIVRWDDLLALIGQAIDEYNARPHRALPRVEDPATGRRRHQAPNEAWRAAVDAGAEILTPEGDADLFRPQVRRTARRGEVALFGNTYFSHDLEEWNGRQVHVAYDVHDPSRVWVRDPEGLLICVAELDGNRRDYYPASYVKQRREARARGRRRRLEAQLEEVEAERQGGALEAAPHDLTEAEIEAAEDELARLTSEVAEDEAPGVVLLQGVRRPIFQTDREKYLWLLDRPDEIDRDDEGWLDWYRSTDEWWLMFGPKDEDQMELG